MNLKIIIFKLNIQNRYLNTFMSSKIVKTPITYAFFYHLSGYKKDQTSECKKLFLDHVKKTTKIPSAELSNEINMLIHKKVSDQKCKRELMQAINLELTIEGVQDLFKNLMNSKEISRQEIEEILDKVNNKL